MSASIAPYRRHEALPVPITRRGRALQTVGGSSHLFDALSAWPVCRVTYSILRFRGFARPDFLVSSRLLSWLSDPPRHSDSPASRRSSLSFTHQVQSVPDPHPDGAGAKPDDFVGMIPPKAIFAQAAKPPRLRQPHDAVQLQRREFRQLLLAGLCGFGHRALCTSRSARKRLSAQKSEGESRRCQTETVGNGRKRSETRFPTLIASTALEARECGLGSL